MWGMIRSAVRPSESAVLQVAAWSTPPHQRAGRLASQLRRRVTGYRPGARPSSSPPRSTGIAPNPTAGRLARFLMGARAGRNQTCPLPGRCLSYPLDVWSHGPRREIGVMRQPGTFAISIGLFHGPGQPQALVPGRVARDEQAEAEKPTRTPIAPSSQHRHRAGSAPWALALRP
jgi:hypothetical protein